MVVDVTQGSVGAHVGVGQCFLEESDGVSLQSLAEQIGRWRDSRCGRPRRGCPCGRPDSAGTRHQSASAGTRPCSPPHPAPPAAVRDATNGMSGPVRTRAELHGVEAEAEVFLHLAFQFATVVRGGAAGGVTGQRVVAAAAEQLVDRHAQRLALEVQQGGLDAAEHDGAEAHPRPELARGEHAPAEHIQIQRRLADEDRLVKFHDGRHHFRDEVSRVGFAQAGQLRSRSRSR